MFTPLPESRMRRRVYLMRHGEVAYFDAQGKPVHADTVPLTERGQAQAAAAGEFLSDVPFDAAFHTGLPRTQQTAEGAVSGRDLTLQLMPELEEIRAGDMSGMTKEEVKRNFINVFDFPITPDQKYGNGDNIVDFRDRVAGAFQKVLLTPGWSNILIVAHSMTNSMILSWIVGGDVRAAKSFDQDPGCINIIDADIDTSGPNPVIKKCFIKGLNMTPLGLNKLGYNLTTSEQLFVLRKKMMAEQHNS